MKVKEESEEVGFKLNIQKMKIMASGPITSWEIDGETMETVLDFIFLDSKITVDGACSHEIRKMVTITPYARQQKRHRCTEQSFGLCGRGRGWDDLGEWH